MLFFRVTPTGGNGDGDNYLDITGTLAAGETEITLTDSHIETDGIYDFYTSKYGVVPTAVEIAAGSITLTFDVQSENIIVMVRKWGESGGISGGGSTIEVVQQNNVSIRDETEITLNLTKKYKDPYVFPTNVQPIQTWTSTGLVIVDEVTGVTYDSTNNTLTFKVFCNNGQTMRAYNISWVIIDLASSESGGGSHSLTFTTLLNEKINAANVTKTLSDSIQNYDALIFRFGDSRNDSSFPERQTRNVFVNDINFCIENNLHYTISWATNYITLDFSGTDSVTSNLTRGLTIYEIIGVKY